MNIKFDFSGVCEFELTESEEKKVMSFKKKNNCCKYLANLIEQKLKDGTLIIKYNDLHYVNPETIRSTNEYDNDGWPLVEWEYPSSSR